MSAPRHAAIGFALFTLAIDALGIGLIIPIVPALVRELSGGDAADASGWMGVLVASFAATQFLAAPVLGALSDRFGRRPVILLSVAGLGANYVVLALAPSIGWLFLGRLMAGATSANISATTAYIADLTPPEKRAARFGLVGATFGLGFVLGPALGGLLGAYGLRMPFEVAAGLAGANALFGLAMLPESLPPERRRPFAWLRANPVGSLGTLVADPVTARLAAAWCFTWFGLGALQSVFVLYTGLVLGWGTAENGTALAVSGLGSALVQGVLIRRVIVWLGERRTFLAGCLFSAAGYATFAAAGHGWMVYAGMGLLAFGALNTPSLRAMISRRAGPERQGEMQGALAALQSLISVGAPVLGASLFGAFARPGAAVHFPGAPMLLAALAYLAAAAVAATLTPAALETELSPASAPPAAPTAPDAAPAHGPAP